MYYNFYRLKGDRGRLARNFIQIGDVDRVEAIKKDDYFLPLLLYYGSGRLWINIVMSKLKNLVLKWMPIVFVSIRNLTRQLLKMV